MQNRFQIRIYPSDTQSCRQFTRSIVVSQGTFRARPQAKDKYNCKRDRGTAMVRAEVKSPPSRSMLGFQTHGSQIAFIHPWGGGARCDPSHERSFGFFWRLLHILEREGFSPDSLVPELCLFICYLIFVPFSTFSCWWASLRLITPVHSRGYSMATLNSTSSTSGHSGGDIDIPLVAVTLTGSLLSVLGTTFILICYMILPQKRHIRHALIINLTIAGRCFSSMPVMLVTSKDELRRCRLHQCGE